MSIPESSGARGHRGDPPGPTTPAAGVLDECLRRTADGDRISFRALYDLLFPYVHDSATCLFGHGDQAANLTTAVFVDVWRLAHEYRPGGEGARTWVLGIAGRHTIGHYRPGIDPGDAGNGGGGDELLSRELDALLRDPLGPR